MSIELYAGRDQVLKYFKDFLAGSGFGPETRIRVAVVGGSRNEPELRVLNEMGVDYEVSILNIVGDTDFFIDLNIETNSLPEIKFDLVLCSQVFEHIWNIPNAIEILKKLTIVDGLIFLNVPYSNMVHRDEVSDFFTPGYSSTFLALNFENSGLKVLISKNIGTRRLYNSIHFLQVWLFAPELINPFIYGRSRFKRLAFLHRIKELPRCLLLFTWSNKWVENGQFSTESFIIAKRV